MATIVSPNKIPLILGSPGFGAGSLILWLKALTLSENRLEPEDLRALEALKGCCGLVFGGGAGVSLPPDEHGTPTWPCRLLVSYVV